MYFENFTGGNHFTIGAELELRILDKYKLTLKNEYDYIFKNINSEYKSNIAKEFLNSMIEINTPVFHDEKSLIEYLNKIMNNLVDVASKKSLAIQASGTYAQKNEQQELNINQRYEKLYDEHQYLLENFSICGIHIHIGFEDFDKALKAYNYSLFYLPLFVALCASSVFYENKNTGIHSYRTKIFDRLPKASIPEYFDSFVEMKKLYELLKESNVIDSGKDIWWDIRIQPHLKTVEFRICDAINDFDRLEVAIALIKGLCQLSLHEKFSKTPMQILKQNMWSATRYSMEGNMITNEKNVIPIRQMLNNIAEKLFEKSLLSKELFEKSKKVIKQKSISSKMLETYNRTNSIKEVERIGVFE
jgi:glutamate---cysteine ligase / carboxylate-amine ligase